MAEAAARCAAEPGMKAVSDRTLLIRRGGDPQKHNNPRVAIYMVHTSVFLEFHVEYTALNQLAHPWCDDILHHGAQF